MERPARPTCRPQNLGAKSPASLKIYMDRLAGMLWITTIDAAGSINCHKCAG
jgi:hypothetical protein